MKEKIILILSLFFLIPITTLATEGVCSYHSGANCGIGAINYRAVCNDGWLSSVPYGDMEECIGYTSACKTYLNDPQYTTTKTALKNDLNIKKDEIDKLEFDLKSLDYEEAQALADLQESVKGRGVTVGGLQPQINAINREYDQKRVETSQQLNIAINQYNTLVKQYNSICRNYTYEEKNGICIKNFGSQYKLVGDICLLTCPVNSYPLNGQCYCNNGYELNLDKTSCVLNINCPANSTKINNQCVCNDGYVKNLDACITYTQNCQNIYGANSYGDKYSCYCSSGYEWNSAKTACIQSVICPLNSSKINNVCLCDNGYEWDSTKITCLRIEEPQPIVKTDQSIAEQQTSEINKKIAEEQKPIEVSTPDQQIQKAEESQNQITTDIGENQNIAKERRSFWKSFSSFLASISKAFRSFIDKIFK